MLTWTRRVFVCVLLGFFLLAPAFGVLSHQHLPAAQRWFLFTGSLVFVLLTWVFAFGEPGSAPVPWPALVLILALGISIFVVGRENFLTVLAVAAAACGRFSATPRPAMLAGTVCALAGLIVAVRTDASFGATLADIAIAPMAAFFAYAAGRRVDMVNMLRRTRAELARAAVSEERLRIARDLHDLLGHSLSLITLKAELAGRLMTADPDRAAVQIAELEAVARQSLSDVRAAVAGYRQPDLAGELAAAHSLLAAAGIASQIDSVSPGELPDAIDAALAWAVREGTTNVVRHSRATRVTICVHTAATTAVAEISDNGPAAADTGPEGIAALPAAPTAGPAGRALLTRTRFSLAGTGRAAGPGWTAGPGRAAITGSGLAGLAERVRSLGGELAAGTVEPHGFLLRVVVPLNQRA